MTKVFPEKYGIKMGSFVVVTFYQLVLLCCLFAFRF